MAPQCIQQGLPLKGSGHAHTHTFREDRGGSCSLCLCVLCRGWKRTKAPSNCPEHLGPLSQGTMMSKIIFLVEGQQGARREKRAINPISVFPRSEPSTRLCFALQPLPPSARPGYTPGDRSEEAFAHRPGRSVLHSSSQSLPSTLKGECCSFTSPGSGVCL